MLDLVWNGFAVIGIWFTASLIAVAVWAWLGIRYDRRRGRI